MSLQWFCFCFMDDIDPALIAENQGFTFGVPLKRMFLPRKLQKKPEKKIKLKMFA